MSLVNDDIRKEIERFKEEKDFVILAHYYVDGSVQEIADYVGDSFYLAKIATKIDKKNILFAGVSFMGESAKLLNPSKHVYMVDTAADCPMAHMVTPEDIKKIRETYDDVAVVCYVNSTAEIKTFSDVCVTSSNATKVVANLSEKNIYFIPDNNLGRYTAKLLPDKNFIFNNGYCPIHKELTVDIINKARAEHPGAEVLTHPECTEEVLKASDFIGSTSQIIDYATESSANEFIIATENGIFYELKMKNPDKNFYPAGQYQVCANMKKITIEKLLNVLNNPKDEVILSDDVMATANKPLERMLELSK